MKPLVLLVTLSIPMRARAPLSLGGVRQETGLAAFAGSETEFDLKGLHQKFTALVGADNRSGDHATVDFVVLGDGRELWRSGPMKKTDPPKTVAASLAGVHKLTLHAIGAGDEGNRSQADWAGPEVSKAGR